MKNFIVVCDNLRSCYNVGSIFRTADALAVEKIYLSGFTPSPEDNFKKIQKTALGAIDSVQWQKIKNTWRILKKLKEEGYYLIALEKTKNSLPFYKFKKRKNKIVIVLGNEIKGLSPNILKRCDIILEIPMVGIKESLNVSVAFGIIGYWLKYKN